MRLIDADKAIKLIKQFESSKNESPVMVSTQTVIKFLDSINVEYVLEEAEWISRDDDDLCIWCSKCYGYFPLPDVPSECDPIEDFGLYHCPSCGRKMKWSNI